MSDAKSVRQHLSCGRVMGVRVSSVDRVEVDVESTQEWSPAALTVGSAVPECGTAGRSGFVTWR